MSVLSDRDIRAALDAGTVGIRPYDPADVQPSSVDLHVDGQFRVFRNNRYPFIDVRNEQPDLTELVEVPDGYDAGALWNDLAKQHPGLAPYRSSISCAVNEDYAKFTTRLKDGDEVAFMPPVSGGCQAIADRRCQPLGPGL